MRRSRWLNIAGKQFGRQLEFIKKDSPQNTQKVAKEILGITNALSNNPEAHGLNKYKINNDGSFRYFEKHHLGLHFQIRKIEIVILRCRHTSMKPRTY